jgi:hypothetical protein
MMVGFLGLALSAGVARADQAITFGAAPDDFTAGFDGTRGWEFTLSQAINVTALGFWDADGDGLANAHEVGIFDTSSALLISATVPSGTVAPLVGPDGFRYVTLLSPLLLDPGTYRIGATFSDTDADQAAREVAPAAAAGLTYVGPRFTTGAGLSDPTEPSGNAEGIFGPNFQFNPVGVVPEPSTFILAGLGGLSLVGVLRRRGRG